MKLTFDLAHGKIHTFPLLLLYAAWKGIKVKRKALICLKQMIREKANIGDKVVSQTHMLQVFVLCVSIFFVDPCENFIGKFSFFFFLIFYFLFPFFDDGKNSMTSEKSSILKLNRWRQSLWSFFLRSFFCYFVAIFFFVRYEMLPKLPSAESSASGFW